MLLWMESVMYNYFNANVSVEEFYLNEFQFLLI